jgi:hypothetical protein
MSIDSADGRRRELPDLNCSGRLHRSVDKNCGVSGTDHFGEFRSQLVAGHYLDIGQSEAIDIRGCLRSQSVILAQLVTVANDKNVHV